MPKSGRGKPKTNRPLFRSSPKTEVMVERLRYVGEHVFGGDMEAYARAVGFSEEWLKQILRFKTRFRISTFINFVESGVIAAEWLFCGTGPMVARKDRHDDVQGFTPIAPINSCYPVFDTRACAPYLPKPVKKFMAVKPGEPTHVSAQLALAKDVFLARSLGQPVILFLDEADIRAGVAPIVIELIQRKYVSAVALTSSAAALDYYSAKQSSADSSALLDTIRLAAAAGVGFGEGVGRWGFIPDDMRNRSIIAAAYDLSVPATVHTTIGDHAFHSCPALYGAEFGAVLGSTSYIDLLVFIEHVCALAAGTHGVFIISPNSGQLADSLFATAASAGQRLIPAVEFKHVNAAILIGDLIGDCRAVFPAFLTACNLVYEGADDDYANKHRTKIESS